MRALVFVGLLVVIVLSARFACSRNAVSRSAAPEARDADSLPDVARRLSEPLVVRDASEAREVVRAEEAAPVPTFARASVTLDGTWTVVDRDDVALAPQDGRFTLRCYDDVAEESHDVELAVVAGRWSLDVPRDAVLEVLAVKLGGRRAQQVGNGARVAVPADARVDFTARWVEPVVLTVIDANTSVSLSDLTVIGGTLDDVHGFHPGDFGPERVIVDGASSPVVLPIADELLENETLWVRAPGHGWGSIVVPRALGGEFLLALRPGGALAVEVVGIPPAVALTLRVRVCVRGGADVQDEENVLFETSLTGDAPFATPPPPMRPHVALDSIAAGSYQVAVEVGSRYRDPRAIVAREVEVRAGATTEVVLDVSAYRPPAFVAISGTLTLSPAWKLNSFGLYFELVGEPAIDGLVQRYLDRTAMRVVDAELGVHAFRFERAQPGRWELRFSSFGTSLAVDVPPSGLDGVHLEVPDPAVVTVRVVDVQTDAPVSDVEVVWMPDRSALESGGVLNGAGDRGGGVFGFTAPRGRLEVWCLSERWEFRRAQVEAVAGPNEVRIETRRACGVVVRVRDGATTLRTADFAPKVRLAQSASSALEFGEEFAGSALRFTVAEPGRYVVELAPPTGYRAPPATEVVVSAHAFVELLLDVDRE
ncbi:MAG: hypothetical protein K8S98_01740 [Planctomycetes bacterium]|nr:hypothetical protein [Planctomycetota bacterium]